MECRGLGLRVLWAWLASLTVLLAGAEKAQAANGRDETRTQTPVNFPDLPLPPLVEGLPGVLRPPSATRAGLIALVRREAEKQGVPPDLADAVAYVESSYNPQAFGGVGEVGLMQIRPQTAAMLGYKGQVSALYEPEVNVR